MNRSQTTLKSPVSIEGIGLHSGKTVRAAFRPAGENSGIRFHRLDRPGTEIPALVEFAAGFDHATTLRRGEDTVATVEHALSAAYGLGIDNLDVSLDAAELPILDGSALPFVRLFQAAGRERLRSPISPLVVRDRIEIVDGDRSISIEPAGSLVITYEIDFPHRAIGRQARTFDFGEEEYGSAISPARTFGFLSDVERLRSRGLALGGSLHNAVVLDDENILSGPLRFPDEFIRHKILDLVGDLALLGRPLLGRIHARRAGHALHARLVAALRQEEALARDESSGRLRLARPRA